MTSIEVEDVGEDRYTSFAGTFADGDHVHTVLTAKATCACGKFKDAPFGWEGSLTDALHSLLK